MRRHMEEVGLVAAAPGTHCRSRTPPRCTTRPRIWCCEDSKVCTLLLVAQGVEAAGGPNIGCRPHIHSTYTTGSTVGFCARRMAGTEQVAVLVGRVALAAAAEAVSDNQCSRHSQTRGTWRSTSAS